MTKQQDSTYTTLIHTHKDSLFKDLFKDPSNFIQLLTHCRGTTPNLTPSDLQVFDLESMIAIRPQRNDVSFITTDNKLIILAEHQSTPCANMALRLFLYYLEMLQLWLKQNNIKLYGPTKISNLPLPEFYVAYNGKTQLDDTVSTFNIDCNNVKINVQVQIVDIHYNNLHDQAPTNYLAGYAFLYHHYDTAVKSGKTQLEAFTFARDMCIMHGYLQGIVQKEGFIMDYKDIFDRDLYLLEEGIAKGKAEGVIEAALKMLKKGLDLHFVADTLQLTETQLKQLKQLKQSMA